jgi:hypothetical protein
MVARRGNGGGGDSGDSGGSASGGSASGSGSGRGGGHLLFLGFSLRKRLYGIRAGGSSAT